MKSKGNGEDFSRKKSGTNASTLPRSWQPEKVKFADFKAIRFYKLKGGPTGVWEEGHKILLSPRKFW